MSFRTRVANRIAGKAVVLGKEDFGDWESFIAAYGQVATAGSIRWNNWEKQRLQYVGTSYACIRKIATAVAAAPLHLYLPDGDNNGKSKRVPVSDETKDFLSTLPFCKATLETSDEVEEITEHPALSVLKRANGAMSRQASTV